MWKDSRGVGCREDAWQEGGDAMPRALCAGTGQVKGQEAGGEGMETKPEAARSHGTWLGLTEACGDSLPEPSTSLSVCSRP